MGKRRLRARWDFPRIWFSTSAVPRAAVRGKLLRLEEETFAGTMGQAVLVVPPQSIQIHRHVIMAKRR